MADYTKQIDLINSNHMDGGLQDTEAKIHISSNKIVTIPTTNFNTTVALQYDNNSNEIVFECDRYVDGHDLFNCSNIRIFWENPSAPENAEDMYKSGMYEASESRRPGENEIETFCFSWIIDASMTEYTGPINFQVVFLDLKESDNPDTADVTEYIVVYRWAANPVTHTNTNNYLRIGASLSNAKETSVTQTIIGVITSYDSLNSILKEVYQK